MTKDHQNLMRWDLITNLEKATERLLKSQQDPGKDPNAQQVYNDALDTFVYREGEPRLLPERKRLPKASSVDEAVPAQLRKDAAKIAGWFLRPERTSTEQVQAVMSGWHQSFTLKDPQNPNFYLEYHPDDTSASVYAYWGPRRLYVSRTETGEVGYLTIQFNDAPKKNISGSVGLRRPIREWKIDDTIFKVEESWRSDKVKFEDAMQAAGVMAQQVLRLMREHPPKEFAERNMRTRR